MPQRLRNTASQYPCITNRVRNRLTEGPASPCKGDGMDRGNQDERYTSAAAEFGPALERLVRSYEADPAERRDLLQDIHFALWRSFAGFEGRCSLRTWVYRVAHNTASSHVSRRKRSAKGVSIEELEMADDSAGPEKIVGEQRMLEKLMTMI